MLSAIATSSLSQPLLSQLVANFERPSQAEEVANFERLPLGTFLLSLCCLFSCLVAVRSLVLLLSVVCCCVVVVCCVLCALLIVLVLVLVLVLLLLIILINTTASTPNSLQPFDVHMATPQNQMQLAVVEVSTTPLGIVFSVLSVF